MSSQARCKPTRRKYVRIGKKESLIERFNKACDSEAFVTFAVMAEWAGVLFFVFFA